MLRFLLPPLLFLPALACADRVFTVPTGYVLRPGEFRIEHIVGLDFAPTSHVQVGLPAFLELQISRDPHDTALGVLYSVSQPFADYFPGLSIGVLDILGEKGEGRTVFAALTFQSYIESDWAYDEFASITVGVGSPPLRGAFIGLVIPMHRGVTLIGEHDSRIMTVGLQIDPLDGVALRTLLRDGKPLIGVQIFRRF